MCCFSWFRRKKKTTAFEPWEKVSTAKIPQPVQDNRQYLEHSDYQLPKDAEEDVRLNFQHHALYHAIGSHYVAPIGPPQPAILDVGTGTGIWVSEMTRQFPESLIVGIDLSDRSFKEATTERYVFRVGNVLTGLPFPEEFFSFTHQRLLVAGITAEKWPRVVRELVRVTRAGGWLELVEIDDQMHNAGPATARVQEFMTAVSKSLGFDGEIIRHLGDLLLQEGLQSVEMQPIPVPVGEWAGRVGQMMKYDLLAACHAIKGRYCTQASLSGVEFDLMIQAMVQEWETMHPTCTFFAAYGKRGTP